MRSITFQRIILSVAVIGGSALALGAAVAQEQTTRVAAEAAGTKDALSQLVLYIAAKKGPRTVSPQLALEDCIEVSIQNRGKSAVTLLEPGENSDTGCRTPIIGCSIINANDAGSKHPDVLPLNGNLYCGNYNKQHHLFTLAAGRQRNIGSLRRNFGAPPIMFKLWSPGRYRVVFYYTNDPKKQFADFPIDPRVKASTPCVLRSNEIILTLIGAPVASKSAR